MANLKGKVIPVHATKAYGEVEIELHTFLTSVLEVRAQFYVPSALPWGNKPSIPIKCEEGWVQGRSGRFEERKYLAPGSSAVVNSQSPSTESKHYTD